MLCVLMAILPVRAERVAGLHQPVEILRDRWGVPHIYAHNTGDLFFAQGWMAAKDRLFQIDLWRRAGTGKLAEVLGPSAIARDRAARLVRFRGDWAREWSSYAPDAREIVTAFVNGINAYIKSLKSRPIEFRIADYDPGLWSPEDVVSRVAGLGMMGNLTREVELSEEISAFGANTVEKYEPPNPFVHLIPPPGVDLRAITEQILAGYRGVLDEAKFSGSNNWVIDGSMSATGKPLLANDPHRAITLPSLRRTVHLVAPGWDAIGAGEPALPGIALGHNGAIGFGLTVVGTDQEDLYVEKLNPSNPDQYLYRKAWKPVEIERQQIPVKGTQAATVELRYTQHGPIIYEDRPRHLAYTLKWVGAEPGGAGYLAGISLARAKNWSEFLTALARFKVPSENMVYADRSGNIGWVAAGLNPIRKNWTGLLPVPGDGGEYEWNGFVPISEMPQVYNPARHFLATSNNNILPPGYGKQIAYEWADPFRVERVREMLSEPKKFSVADFERMQYDVVSLPARRLQAIVRRSPPAGNQAIVDEFLKWDARLTPDSRAAMVFEMWLTYLSPEVFPEWRGPLNLEMVLTALEQKPNPRALTRSLDRALADLHKRIPNPDAWRWSVAHTMHWLHPLNREELNLPATLRPGDADTVDAAGGRLGASGATFREILDLSNWDQSMMTNAPGESGDPESKHYRDLLHDWIAGRYHPMPFSRRAVEAATEERIMLEPAR